MPKAKKNVKLKDQKPIKDPKGGRRGHHHLRGGSGSGRDPDAGGGGGLLP